MSGALVWLGLCLATAGAPARPESAADALTLRDGKVVLGQVVDNAPRGNVTVIVRRVWAESKLPERLKVWDAEAAPAYARAERQRRERLEAWKRDRSAAEGGNDRILAWIQQDLATLAEGAEAVRTPLLVVTLKRGDVRGIVRRPKSLARLLRLGWRSGFPTPETMTPEALKNALEGRGFDLSGSAPVALDDLLPVPSETDDQWITRRAATEAVHDPGVKFIHIGPLVIPEPAAGQPLGADFARPALANLSKLLNGATADPVPDALRGVAALGRVGAVVTRQETSPNLDAATVEITLWVRRAGGRWAPHGSRMATVRGADLKGDEVNALAGDPQVQAAFNLARSFGLGDQITEEMKRSSLNMGAATQKALGLARSAIQNDLANLALPIEGKLKKEDAPK